MSLAVIHSRASAGIEAPPVTIEAHLSKGLPGLSIVGLPETAVKESRDRVRSAILNTNFTFPAKRIVINLAPADLPKEGGRFDLPIALSILAASGQIPREALNEYEIVGELALSGELRPIVGALPLAIATRKVKRILILPEQNAFEAALPGDINVIPAKHIMEVCSYLIGELPIKFYTPKTIVEIKPDELDFADVQGQVHAKRALEIAAAGNHSLMMVGPPGTGKTMLACRLPGILPSMSEEEALEIAAIQSITTKQFNFSQWKKRPFRAPHHTCSGVALVGGGSSPRPGEISLAHNGVLFLDELPEYSRHVLETLREPMESGKISISRALCQAEFPAKFQLVAAMNPCPCGHLGDPLACCRCTEEQVRRYRNRLSGPLLDRIDIHIEVSRLAKGMLTRQPDTPATASAEIRKRVEQARQLQLSRQGKPNNALLSKDMLKFCALSARNGDMLEKAMEKLGLSARAFHKVLRVARTIADLAGEEKMASHHLLEALNYRSSDRSKKELVHA